MCRGVGHKGYTFIIQCVNNVKNKIKYELVILICNLKLCMYLETNVYLVQSHIELDAKLSSF